MEESGLTFEAVKDNLARLVDNGVCADDPRVITWVNAAQRELLMARDPQTGMTVIPVGAMITADIVANGTGTELFLPKEFRNAIDVEVVTSSAGVRNRFDVRQGWYDIINPFTYVDPNLAQDNPLVDLGLFPDPDDPTIRRRKYDYPGLDAGATVRVTGARAFIEITGDDSYLIVQNEPAIEQMLMAKFKRENGAADEGRALKNDAVMLLVDEIKAFQLDPKQTLKRKAGYEADLVNYAEGAFGHMRARLALELPGGLQMGKSDLTRLVEQCERKLMSKGHWVGTWEEFEAEVTEGRILAPAKVLTILAASLCDEHLDIRNIAFQYMQNATGRDTGRMLIDEGDHYDSKNKIHYRQYRLGGDLMTAYYSTSQVPSSSSSTTGEPGAPGQPGAAGSQLRYGHGVPDNSLGSDGDSYIDVDAKDQYLKTSGVYAFQLNLQGPPGDTSAADLTLNLDVIADIDAVDVDALGLGLEDIRIVMVADDPATIWQVRDGVPGVNDRKVLGHAGWHWEKKL